MFNLKVLPMTGFELRPRVFDALALPIEPQPLTPRTLFASNNMKFYVW